jgi:hypothetical protein
MWELCNKKQSPTGVKVTRARCVNDVTLCGNCVNVLTAPVTSLFCQIISNHLKQKPWEIYFISSLLFCLLGGPLDFLPSM